MPKNIPREPEVKTAGYLRREEAAHYCRLSVMTIDRATATGDVVFFKVGRRNLFRQADLDKWMERFLVDCSQPSGGSAA